MDLALVLVAVTAFPAAGLGFVLWMGRLEDGIPEGVRRATRHPDPPPILAIAIPTPPTRLVWLPQPRRAGSSGRENPVDTAHLVPEAVPSLAPPGT